MAERTLKVELFCIPQPATLGVMVGVRHGAEFRYLNVAERHATDPKVYAHALELLLAATPDALSQLDPKHRPAK